MHHVQRATVLITAIAAAFVLFMAGAALRLLIGPISLGAFSQTIEDVLNRSVSGAVIRFDQVVLEWSRPDHRINLIVLGTKIFDANGRIIAQAPKADLDFDALALLAGRVKLKNFGLIGLQLTGVRTQDGTIRLGFGRDQNEANFLESLRKILKDSSSGRGALESLSLQHARVAFMDEPTGLFIVLPDAALQLKSRTDGFDATLRAAAEISGSPLRIDARADLRDDGTPKRATFRVAGFSLRALSQNSAKLAALKPYALVADISGTVNFDNNGGVSNSELRASGGGTLDVPVPGNNLQVSHFDFDTSIDPRQRHVVVHALRFESSRASFRVSGTVDADWDDNGIARVATEAEANMVQLSAPQFFAKPLSFPDLAFHLTYDRAAQQISWDRVTINTGPITAELSGMVHLGEHGFQDVTVSGNAAPLSVATMLSYWPTGYAQGARDWIATNVTQGEIGPIRINAAIPADAFDAPALPDSALDVSFPFQGLTTTYVRGMTPITRASGNATLHGDSFRLVVNSANTGPVALSTGEVAIPDLHISGTTAHITAHAEGRTADILRLIDEQPLGYPRRFGINSAIVDGRSGVDLDFHIPLLRDLAWDQVAFVVKAKSTGLSLPVAERKLEGANVDFVVNPSSLTATGSGRFATVPVKFQWNEDFGNSAKSTRLDVSGVADDAERAKLGVSLPSWITGPSAFSLTLTGRQFRFNEASIAADLTNVSADFPGLAVRKPTGLAATGTAQIAFDSAGVMSLPDFIVRSNAVNLRGALAMAPGGKVRSLSLSDFRAGADDFAMTLIPSEKGYAVTIQGNTLDIRHLTGLDRSAAPPAQERETVQDPIAIKAQVQRLVLSQRANLRDVVLSVALGPNNRLTAFDLQAGGPGKSSLTGHMSVVKGIRTLDVASDNAGTLIDSVLNFSSVRGGKMSARVTFPEPGAIFGNRKAPPPDYEGTVILSDVVLTDQPFLARLFAAGSLDGPLRLLQGQGISLSNVVIPFNARGHSYMIVEGRAAGESIGGTFTGAFDRDTGKVDISGTLVPIFGLNSVLGAIPVLGDLLVSKKGEGILGLTYQMRGEIAEPTILVNPLSMFTPGILRRIFEFGPAKPPEQKRGERSE